MKKILLLLVLAIGVIYAQGKIVKVEEGFQVFSNKVYTYYENRIIWGDYIDHDEGGGVHNTKVTVWGEGWEFSTTTDDEGNFKVEVKPDSPFHIKASDGSRWAEFNGTLEGVPLGTTKTDKTVVP